MLTCIFYFVGLAYDNVSQVTLFILFIGLLDMALYLAQRAYDMLSTRDAKLLVAQPFRAARRPFAGLKACATNGRRQFRNGPFGGPGPAEAGRHGSDSDQVPSRRKRGCLILIVAYKRGDADHEGARASASSAGRGIDVEVLVLDDSSQDRTFEQNPRRPTRAAGCRSRSMCLQPN